MIALYPNSTGRNVRAPLERHAGNARRRVIYPVKARQDKCHRDDTQRIRLRKESKQWGVKRLGSTEDLAQAGSVNSWWCKEDLGRGNR